MCGKIRPSHANDASVTTGTYYRLVDFKDAGEKERQFEQRSQEYKNIAQSNFSKIPGSPIAYWASSRVINIFCEYRILDDYVETKQGLATGDNDQFIRSWNEVDFNKIGFNCHSESMLKNTGKIYAPHNKGGENIKWVGNNDYVIKFDDESTRILEKQGNKLPSRRYYFLESIEWSRIGADKLAVRYNDIGSIFDGASATLFSKDKQLLFFIQGFINSKVALDFLKILSPSLSFQVGDVRRLPIIIEKIESAVSKVKESIVISRSDWDSRETSWDFQQSPLLNDQPNLPRAYETWQAAVTRDFFQLHANEEELNRIFIGIYGLQDELMPEVALKDITILQDELAGKDLEVLEPRFRAQGATAVSLPIQKNVVMQQFLSYLIGLSMGRYRLDKPGLHIAHPGPTAEEIAPYRYNGHEVDIDEDAILPLMGTACEFPDDVLQRVKHLLDAIWGPDTRTDNLNFLQDCLDSDLEKYLVKQFWKDHCRRYKKKPIYWLFSSPGGAFQVLAYMHRMNAFTAERIRDKYLLPHIKHLRGKVQALDSRSALLNSQEAKQLDRLRKDLAECEAYELVLKDVADRQIEFDLDDGVTRNYGLFEGVVAEIK